MCGIAGFCLNKADNINARKVSAALLNEIQARGTDATGAAWVQRHADGERAQIAVSKAPVAARSFAPYLEQMPTTAKRVILHTRYATQGSPQDNLNNHPIVSGRIVGVHNGVLSNDDQVFATLGGERRGVVDSEAAFALIDRTIYKPVEVLESLQGRAALAWFDARDKRDLHLARLEGSPLAIGFTEGGSLFFASTMPLLVAGCAKGGVKLDWAEELGPMTYIRVRNGEMVDIDAVPTSVKELVA